MVYCKVLLFVCTASLVPNCNVVGQEKVGLTIETEKNALLILQDEETLFADAKTPVWTTQIDYNTLKSTYVSTNNGMKKIIDSLNNFKRRKGPYNFDTCNYINDERNLYCDFKSTVPKQEHFVNTPVTVYPKILVFVDYSLHKEFDDIEETIIYVLTLLNGVDLNFKTMKEPKVRLNIAGIVILREYMLEEESEFISIFNEYLRSSKYKFEDQEFYNIVVLIRAKSMKGETCIARSAVICPKSGLFDATIYDDMKFSGIHYLTISLAHLFGARLDFTELPAYNNGPDSKKCFEDDGYIMGIRKNTKEQFFFSECSQKMMSYFFSLNTSECLRNNPVKHEDKQVLRILPGKYMSLDEQCQIMGFTKAHIPKSSVCLNMLCINGTNVEQPLFETPALEGSNCGNESFCVRGECVHVKIKESIGNINLTHFFPQSALQVIDSPTTQICKYTKKSSAESNSSKSNLITTNPTENNSTESNLPKSNSTENNLPKSNSTENNSTESNSSKSNLTKNNPTKNNSTESNLPKSNSTENNSTESNSSNSNSTKNKSRKNKSRKNNSTESNSPRIEKRMAKRVSSASKNISDNIRMKLSFIFFCGCFLNLFQ